MHELNFINMQRTNAEMEETREFIDHEQTRVYVESFAFCQILGTFARLKTSCMSAT